MYEMEFGYESDLDEYEGEFEDEYETEWEYEDEVLDPDTEMEMAAELLAVQSEDELDEFLGKLVKRVARGARSALRNPALKGLLKSVARKALPIAGTFLGGPLGGVAAKAAGSMLGLEAEGMSDEDMEFEAARRVVRIASTATRQTSRAPASAPPAAVARRAVQVAVRRHAPGWPGGRISGGSQGRRSSGRWVRRGRSIVLIGA